MYGFMFLYGWFNFKQRKMEFLLKYEYILKNVEILLLFFVAKFYKT